MALQRLWETVRATSGPSEARCVKFLNCFFVIEEGVRERRGVMDATHGPGDGKRREQTCRAAKSEDGEDDTKEEENGGEKTALACVSGKKRGPEAEWLVVFVDDDKHVVCLQHVSSMSFVGEKGGAVFLSSRLCFARAARFSLCRVAGGPFAGLVRLCDATGAALCLAPSGKVVMAASQGEGTAGAVFLNSLWRLERCGAAVALRNMFSGGLLVTH